jgi:ABC-2 type transport system ATP-binding protein
MIEAHGMTKRFGDLTAVDHVNFTVGEGEVVALLGPNGAGKTTTVRMLAAILKPTAGSAQIAGYDVLLDARQVRRHVGMLTEAPGLYTRMTGREYLDFFGELRGLPASERQQRVDRLAERFRMLPALDRRLGQYSKGMAQKITLMRTLLHDPSVLLLDEPTSAMDPESARLVRDMILRLRDGRRAIMICTHNLPEAEELADRILIIRQGQIVANGSIADLKAQLLGAPLMEARFVKPSADGVGGLISDLAPVVAKGESWVRYRTEEPERINPAVARVLTEAGVALVSLREVPRSLEAVYLCVVGEAR